jgi:hypothetical protein
LVVLSDEDGFVLTLKNLGGQPTCRTQKHFISVSCSGIDGKSTDYIVDSKLTATSHAPEKSFTSHGLSILALRVDS